MSKLDKVLPSLSIIVPSFNQAEFLHKTLDSIISQKFEGLEIIVIDGGSDDGSVDIIKSFDEHISYWISEPDEGQVEAINKGLKLATGEWVGWQNSDDIYLPGAFSYFIEQANRYPDVELITGNLALINESGSLIREVHYVKPVYNAIRAEGMVLANQAAFWRRHIHDKIGYLDPAFHCSFDYEWFLRVTKYYKATHVCKTLGALRQHNATKSNNLSHIFEEDHKRILEGREPSNWMVRSYQLRRLFLLLVMGDFRYVIRGLKKRLLHN